MSMSFVICAAVKPMSLLHSSKRAIPRKRLRMIAARCKAGIIFSWMRARRFSRPDVTALSHRLWPCRVVSKFHTCGCLE